MATILYRFVCSDSKEKAPTDGAIHQEAYFSILKGESLKNIRFRYEKEMDAYVREHMWDD